MQPNTLAIPLTKGQFNPEGARELLCSIYRGMTPLCDAVSGGHAAVTELLLKHGQHLSDTVTELRF